MSYELLKDNIESLISQKNYRVSKVEELAGIKHGNLSNILTGRSKKPSAEILLSIANVFGVTVEELFKNKAIQPSKYLTKEELNLFLNIITYLINQIESKKIPIYYKDFIFMVNEVYEYSSSN
ncbi:helix-turn-helix domain-containing protein, partial [Candidatus Megaera venefica]|uniref:helix-turn-helix domain-containing protein n=1 Tax=Candidatus Megaera venefica TaxID=2055910 RepID=UPI002AD1DF12